MYASCPAMLPDGQHTQVTVAEAARLEELQRRLADVEAARLCAETVQRSAVEDAEHRCRRMAARHEAQLQVPFIPSKCGTVSLRTRLQPRPSASSLTPRLSCRSQNLHTAWLSEKREIAPSVACSCLRGRARISADVSSCVLRSAAGAAGRDTADDARASSVGASARARQGTPERIPRPLPAAQRCAERCG